MDKRNKIVLFLSENGLKKGWLASKLGMSQENLWYHLKRGDNDLRGELRQAALEQLQELAIKIMEFCDENRKLD